MDGDVLAVSEKVAVMDEGTQEILGKKNPPLDYFTERHLLSA